MGMKDKQKLRRRKEATGVMANKSARAGCNLDCSAIRASYISKELRLWPIYHMSYVIHYMSCIILDKCLMFVAIAFLIAVVGCRSHRMLQTALGLGVLVASCCSLGESQGVYFGLVSAIMPPWP